MRQHATDQVARRGDPLDPHRQRLQGRRWLIRDRHSIWNLRIITATLHQGDSTLVAGFIGMIMEALVKCST
jgi:hypothetical protein